MKSRDVRGLDFETRLDEIFRAFGPARRRGYRVYDVRASVAMAEVGLAGSGTIDAELRKASLGSVRNEWPTFPVVVRGYDRERVDEYFEDAIAELSASVERDRNQ